VKDLSGRLAHEAKAGEVASFALDLLILLRARGVITGELKVTEGSTCLGHHLLKLLLLVREAVLLVVTLPVVVPLGVVVLVGGVKLFTLGAVSDKVGGVAALEAALRRSPPLLAKLVQVMKLSR
jgi:hypothetical protein